MKNSNGFSRIVLTRLGLFVTCFFLVSAAVQACTIFVLTDTNRVLFCNNEDWSDFNTRIWFVPGKPGTNGCAYVGFTNGWAQGGLNTEGLAFDWVAGNKDKLDPDPKMKALKGNSSARMLQCCATVEEAIVFYQTYEERAFTYAKILVADRTGASVIVGARDGHLVFDRTSQCRGFGAGQQALSNMLTKTTEPTLSNAAKILQAARSEGQYATKYSNVFDLKSGDIFLFPIPGRQDMVTLNLGEELKKGRHAYDMPKIKEQLAQSPTPISGPPKDK
jgi:hypothetical protein